MRDQITIRAELGEANAAYHAAAAGPEAQWRPLSDRVKALQQELAAAITLGANPCSRCGAPPHGLRHVAMARGKGAGVVWYHTFEVGCLACEDGTFDAAGVRIKPGENRPVARVDDRRGFAETPREETGADLDRHAETARAAAVAKWNEKNPTA